MRAFKIKCANTELIVVADSLDLALDRIKIQDKAFETRYRDNIRTVEVLEAVVLVQENVK